MKLKNNKARSNCLFIYDPSVVMPPPEVLPFPTVYVPDDFSIPRPVTPKPETL